MAWFLFIYLFYLFLHRKKVLENASSETHGWTTCNQPWVYDDVENETSLLDTSDLAY
jgi:hypothetical protein